MCEILYGGYVGRSVTLKAKPHIYYWIGLLQLCTDRIRNFFVFLFVKWCRESDN